MSECPRESDVLDAIASRRWPERADEDLRTHVAACAACKDLAAVAGALLYEEEAAYAEARMPAAASVWHRAQLRAREEAVRAATRPIGFVQGMAFACAIAVAIGAAVWGLPIIASLLPDLTGVVSSLRARSLTLPRFDVDATALIANGTIQIAVAVWAVITPVALYLTLRDSNS